MTLTRGPTACRYEGAVVVHAGGAWDWEQWRPPIAAACAAGMTVGVVVPEIPPAGLQDGFDPGTGTLLAASHASAECVIVDRNGVRAGRREATEEGQDPLAWIAEEMWQRGVGPSATLVLDRPDEAAALAAQAQMHRVPTLPEVRPEPGWDIASGEFDVDRLRVNAALFVLSDGVVGASGASLVRHPGSRRWVLVGGTYVGTGPDTHLLSAPVAFQLPYDMAEPPDLRRTLDLHAGVLREEVTTTAGPLTSVRFVSMARPGAVALRAAGPGAAEDSQPVELPLLESDEDTVLDSGRSGTASWMRTAGEPGGVVAAATDARTGQVLDRVAIYLADPDRLPDPDEAVAQLEAATAAGFDSLLVEHREAWARRWADADVAIEGDTELQRAVRFSLFHLMSSVPDVGEAAVGARGLSGPGYRGHVFWDADTFTLPFLAATHPGAARAMLEYRLRRLPAALELAAELGREGARFPWESAHSGRDVTPTSARDRTGRVVPIRTGLLEEHIVAQVALAACCYTDWTGDDDFARGPGLELLVQTARYWASRVRVDAGGSAHIYGVIGPDEYHEPVDDNAFTNVMARWNLRRAAQAVTAAGGGADPHEVARWLDVADSLVDGYDPDTGVYEQFSGFHTLEPLIISEVAPRRPIAADLLLGAGRVGGAQVIKQPDVLMLYHLVPEEVEVDGLEPNLRFYEPRTAHGSSLSPAIHASLFARTRNYEAALDLLRIASRIDLDDLTGSTSGGLHIATMGGLWQAFAFGFGGLHPRGGRLEIDPRLPHEWASLELRVRFRGSRVTVQVEHYGLSVRADAPTAVTVQGEDYEVGRRGVSFTRRGRRWEET